jgi:hypothetical protein
MRPAVLHWPARLAQPVARPGDEHWHGSARTARSASGTTGGRVTLALAPLHWHWLRSHGSLSQWHDRGTSYTGTQ